MTRIYNLDSDLFETQLLSPDGRYVLVFGPTDKVRLYETLDFALRELPIEPEFLVRAVAFNLGNYDSPDYALTTSQCALLSDDGSSLIRIDLRTMQLSKLRIRDGTVVAYGRENTIFLGTAGGELIMIDVYPSGELAIVDSPLAVSNFAIVHIAASHLDEDYAAVYCDDGQMFSVKMLSRNATPVDPASVELPGEFVSMLFHPYLPMFVMLRTGGYISVSTPNFWLRLILPQSSDSEHTLDALIPITEDRFLAVSTNQVEELFVTQSVSEEVIATANIVFQVQDGYRIVAVTHVPSSWETDVVVLTTSLSR